MIIQDRACYWRHIGLNSFVTQSAQGGCYLLQILPGKTLICTTYIAPPPPPTYRVEETRQSGAGSGTQPATVCHQPPRGAELARQPARPQASPDTPTVQLQTRGAAPFFQKKM